MTTDEPLSTSPDPDAPRLSFKDREMLTALRRLARAQSQVSSLEEQLAADTSVTWQPEDVDRVEAYEAELVKLRQKAHSRFGGSSARERIGEIELQQRLVLDRLGVGSYAEFDERRRQPVKATPAVDPAFLAFARRELADAEAAYRDTLLLPDDEPPPRVTIEELPDDAGATDDDLPTVPDYPPPIDLTQPEAS